MIREHELYKFMENILKKIDKIHSMCYGYFMVYYH